VRGRGRKSEENVEESKNKGKWRQESKIYHKIYEKEEGDEGQTRGIIISQLQKGKKNQKMLSAYNYQ
jgi:hypothetical protein